MLPDAHDHGLGHLEHDAAVVMAPQPVSQARVLDFADRVVVPLLVSWFIATSSPLYEEGEARYAEENLLQRAA